MEFNKENVRFGVRNIAEKGQTAQWALVATYIGKPEVQAVSKCTSLDHAKAVYNQVRQNPRLAWKAVYVEMVALQSQAVEQSQEPVIEELQYDALPV